MRARLAVTAILLAISPAVTRAEIRILEVEASRLDTMLVCHVVTRGLPDAKSKDTLESGLPSALVLALTLLDAKGHERGTLRTEVRIEPDLWEGILVVRSPFRDVKATTIEDVAAILADLGPLPVAPLRFLDPGLAARVRVKLAVHPLARTEIDRMHALIAGDVPQREDERKEVSVGLGALVRYFLGRSPEETWLATGTTTTFRVADLSEAP
jgi:hypothetical protein